MKSLVRKNLVQRN
jgi:hypothetical protein